ncbi:hypothetical protein [Nocardioides ochotonae]|uniref:hypothetical protein n=1 Tax=Nocardioides ochotonae TaxID=2685869 RepID=UPI00140AD1C0|nr:hypothetical protein [Nocardioides ochotonae]
MFSRRNEFQLWLTDLAAVSGGVVSDELSIKLKTGENEAFSIQPGSDLARALHDLAPRRAERPIQAATPPAKLAQAGPSTRKAEGIFDSPVFSDHPSGWQTPSDLVAGFTLAWALELKERMRLSPHAPSAPGVIDHLPPRYRYDTLGRLIDLGPGATGASFGVHPVVRLTTICGAWQLFDLMNRGWRIRANDFEQFADLLAFVTGGQDRPSLYKGESADISKCILAVRVRRASMQTDELDLAEQWFFSGDDELTFRDPGGNDSLQFHFSGMDVVPLALFSHQFVAAIWSTARVTVEQLGPDRVIALRGGDRLDSLLDLLDRGGAKAQQAQQELAPMEFQRFDNWPGWSQQP